MNKVTVSRVDSEGVTFSNGQALSSEHEQDCCENHYLDFENVSLQDFDGMEFDLEGDFFERVDGYGIRLKPLNGHPVAVPGYGYNNGYYSHELTLVLSGGGLPKREFNISECQEVSD